MPSLLRSFSEEKLAGKFYTPEPLVEEVLEVAGYVPKPKMRVLDPACGDGQFLAAIVRRILRELPPNEWYSALESIEGWDIDAEALHQCRQRLDQLVEPYGLKINWKLIQRDSLTVYSDLWSSRIEPYDFIVGNPPFIRIQHLPDAYKRFLQERFIFCRHGSTDIYLAFFELGLSLLAPHGKLAFITPNTWLYTQAAKDFRMYVGRQGWIKKVVDYDDNMRFASVGAYIAITVLTRESNPVWTYERKSTPRITYTLTKGEWLSNLCKPIRGVEVPLGEIAYIGVGITTLADRIFILKGKPVEEGLFLLSSGERLPIERAILRPIIKASTFKGDEGHPKEYIIFPYQLTDKGYQIIPETQLRQSYPLAYAYLLRHKPELLQRDAGKPNPEGWYAFGRHQNLEASFGEKIIFPSISHKPRFILSLLAECSVYAGYFIKYDGDYELLLRQLNSPRMEEFIRLNSRPFRGGWRAYNKRIVERFPIRLEELR
ncbi:MAG: N-6 DNA methylase [Bacteroidia bacterium]|nr:N-6 DNA methylase [Bacteroidia bacterium]